MNLEKVTFNEIEEMEDVISGSVSGLAACCIDVTIPKEILEKTME